ncbi:hypothetical protein [Bacillus pakistanensis]|uniref:hypothetical protein n=1 Tax=Rossellomorea pakistanensis TaxID=992288 RepID=UPI001EF8E2E3|nr:hypothetical protein [Bacillus pakistanensis]
MAGTIIETSSPSVLGENDFKSGILLSPKNISTEIPIQTIRVAIKMIKVMMGIPP